jgi:ribonuclease P protein component
VRGEHFQPEKIQFKLVYDKGRSWAGREIVVRALPNNLDTSRFGFVASRRIGNAVVRNHVKRLLREIVRHTPVEPGWDIIFIARIPAAVTGFGDLEKSVRNLLFRAGLYIGENEGDSLGTN